MEVTFRCAWVICCKCIVSASQCVFSTVMCFHLLKDSIAPWYHNLSCIMTLLALFVAAKVTHGIVHVHILYRHRNGINRIYVYNLLLAVTDDTPFTQHYIPCQLVSRMQT